MPLPRFTTMPLPFLRRATKDELTAVARQRVVQLAQPHHLGDRARSRRDADTSGQFGGWVPRVPEQNPLTPGAEDDDEPTDKAPGDTPSSEPLLDDWLVGGHLMADPGPSDDRRLSEQPSGALMLDGEPVHDDVQPGTDDHSDPPPVHGRYSPRPVAGAGVADRIPLPLRALWERWAPGLDGARVELGRGQITVVLLVLGAGLIIAALVYGLGRPQVTPVAAEVVATGTPVTSEGSSVRLSDQPGSGQTGASADDDANHPTRTAPDAGDAPAADGSLVVHVAGKVARPGVVTLPVGSRVIDAIEAVGGANKAVDLTPLNLARVLSDGEQVLVGVDPPAGLPSAGENGTDDNGTGDGSGTSDGNATADGLVNLNTSTPEQLESLPGIGPTIAQRIIDWREQNGGFASIDELNEVSGIGAAKFADISPLVTV